MIGCVEVTQYFYRLEKYYHVAGLEWDVFYKECVYRKIGKIIKFSPIQTFHIIDMSIFSYILNVHYLIYANYLPT
jgi:hypothetical protein